MDTESFLERYSDYRDGLMSPEEMTEFEKEISSCCAHARYHEVIEEGVDVLTHLPTAESSDDFMPRLRHRLYNVDEGVATTGHWRGGSAALLGVAGVGILALFWLPFAATVPMELELPPVAAQTPSTVESSVVPALFRAGPFLDTVDRNAEDVLGSYPNSDTRRWQSQTTVYQAQLTKAQSERDNR